MKGRGNFWVSDFSYFVSYAFVGLSKTFSFGRLYNEWSRSRLTIVRKSIKFWFVEQYEKLPSVLQQPNSLKQYHIMELETVYK